VVILKPIRIYIKNETKKKGCFYLKKLAGIKIIMNHSNIFRAVGSNRKNQIKQDQSSMLLQYFLKELIPKMNNFLLICFSLLLLCIIEYLRKNQESYRNNTQKRDKIWIQRSLISQNILHNTFCRLRRIVSEIIMLTISKQTGIISWMHRKMKLIKVPI